MVTTGRVQKYMILHVSDVGLSRKNKKIKAPMGTCLYSGRIFSAATHGFNSHSLGVPHSCNEDCLGIVHRGVGTGGAVDPPIFLMEGQMSLLPPPPPPPPNILLLYSSNNSQSVTYLCLFILAFHPHTWSICINYYGCRNTLEIGMH